MPYVYVGTPAQVAAAQTGNLLLTHPWHAIWCPPPAVAQAWPHGNPPMAGDELLLVWRGGTDGPLVPLGCGTIVAPPLPIAHLGSAMLWTNGSQTGLMNTAQQLGYKLAPTPADTAFLRLEAILANPTLSSAAAGLPLHSGLNYVPAKLWTGGSPLPCTC